MSEREIKVVISLTPTEVMEVERIVLDRNRDDAVEVIEKVIWRKVREASRPH